MTKTENYNLNQWEAEDAVRRTDFNEDNAKLDAVLAGKAEGADLQALQTVVSGKAQASDLTALQNTVAKKADATALTALQTTVAGKADASALTALQTTVSKKADTTALTALQAVVAQKGNCVMETGTYTGNGIYGTEKPTVLRLGYQPRLLFVGADGGFMAFFVQGCDQGLNIFMGNGASLEVQWLADGVSWYVSHPSLTSAVHQFNQLNATYRYIAFK